MALGELPSECVSAKSKAAHSLCMVRAMWVLITLLGITCLTAHAAEDGAAATTAKQQAQICGQAILHNDYEAFVSMAYPKAVLAMGGRNAVIKKLRQANQQRKDQGTSIQAVTIGDVTQIKESKTEMFAIVPQTITLAANGDMVRTEGYLLGISTDRGRTWRFIDGAEVAGLGKQIRTLVPDLPADMQLPEPKEPALVQANTDAQPFQQESDQSNSGDSVELHRSFYTAKLPKGSNIGLANARTDPEHGALVTLPNGNPLAIIVVDDRTTLRDAFNGILGTYRAKLNGTRISPSDMFTGRGGRGSIVSGNLIVSVNLPGTPYCYEAGMFGAKTRGVIVLCGYRQAQPDETRQILRQFLDSLVIKE